LYLIIIYLIQNIFFNTYCTHQWVKASMSRSTNLNMHQLMSPQNLRALSSAKSHRRPGGWKFWDDARSRSKFLWLFFCLKMNLNFFAGCFNNCSSYYFIFFVFGFPIRSICSECSLEKWIIANLGWCYAITDNTITIKIRYNNKK
jgi:hypothetical protein